MMKLVLAFACLATACVLATGDSWANDFSALPEEDNNQCSGTAHEEHTDVLPEELEPKPLVKPAIEETPIKIHHHGYKHHKHHGKKHGHRHHHHEHEEHFDVLPEETEPTAEVKPEIEEDPVTIHPDESHHKHHSKKHGHRHHHHHHHHKYEEHIDAQPQEPEAEVKAALEEEPVIVHHKHHHRKHHRVPHHRYHVEEPCPSEFEVPLPKHHKVHHHHKHHHHKHHHEEPQTEAPQTEQPEVTEPEIDIPDPELHKKHHSKHHHAHKVLTEMFEVPLFHHNSHHKHPVEENPEAEPEIIHHPRFMHKKHHKVAKAEDNEEHHSHEDVDAGKRKYLINFKIHDEKKHVCMGQRQWKIGPTLHGISYVYLNNGRTQVVTYSVCKKSGYVAKVKYYDGMKPQW